MRPLATALLVLASVAPGCTASAPSSTHRAVLAGPEDEEPPSRSRSCSVVLRAELAAPAELGRPALAGGDELTLAWVERHGRERRLVVQSLGPSLRPAGDPEVVEAGEGLPLWPAVARCGQASWLAWQQGGPEADSVRYARLGSALEIGASEEVSPTQPPLLQD